MLADPAAGVDGISVLFLQALHPRAMTGIHEHSGYRTDFWRRLRGGRETQDGVRHEAVVDVSDVVGRRSAGPSS